MLNPKPSVEFNPNLKEHRLAVAAFSKRYAWSDSPIKFKHDSNYRSLAEQVEKQLLAWYMNNDSNT